MNAHLRVAVTDRDHIAGSVDAPITLVEYGDFECPYCGMAHHVVPILQQHYGERLRFVFRHFPLTEIHPRALRAALAAESVSAQLGDPGFWSMHDLLFQNQKALGDEALAAYAASADADPQQLLRDLATQAHLERIEANFSSGVRSGVNGTPTFFINGARFDGDWRRLSEFAEALESAVPA